MCRADEARRLDHRGQRGRIEPRIEQAGRGQVDGDPAVVARRTPRAGVRVPRRARGWHARGRCRARPSATCRSPPGRWPRSIGAASAFRPEEALVFVELARGEVDDGLERDLVQGPQAEEVVERLGLDDLRRLGHPDPVGEARLLDGARERHEVAVRLRQREVDRDESVLGVAPVFRDLVGDGIGQPVGRADQDRARAEVEDARAGHSVGQLVHEPDVPRPEEPLVRRSPGRREEPQACVQRVTSRRRAAWGRHRRSMPSCPGSTAPAPPGVRRRRPVALRPRWQRRPMSPAATGRGSAPAGERP